MLMPHQELHDYCQQIGGQCGGSRGSIKKQRWILNFFKNAFKINNLRTTRNKCKI
jgi:hypothetical protein